jgi:hypothetical protein
LEFASGCSGNALKEDCTRILNAQQKHGNALKEVCTRILNVQQKHGNARNGSSA